MIQISSPITSSVIESAPAQTTTIAAPSNLFEPAETMIEHHLELATDGAWLDQLARDIVEAAGADGRLRFRLTPEHLGTLRVELSQGEQGVSIRLTADSEAARSLIADAQPRLLAEARAQGLRVADAQFGLAGGQAGDSRRQDSPPQEQLLRTGPQTHNDQEPEGGTKPSGSDRYA